MHREKVLIMVKVVTDPYEFKTMQKEWNKLAEKFPTPLLRFEWFEACWERYNGRATLAIFTVRTKGTLGAIAPLVIDRSARVSRLQALAHYPNEPNGFLYVDRLRLLPFVRQS